MNESVKVLVTGASGGIGNAIRNSFIQSGACVYAPGRNELDLSNTESINSYIKKNNDVSFDVLVFCAGINNKASIDKITEDNLNETFQVNVFSTILLIKGFIEKMKESRNGKIIIISSLYSFISKEERISYSCSKNALTGLIKTLALELSPYNICINGIAPGYVLTEMTKRNLSEQELENIRNNIPTGRLQSPEEIADLTIFLASDMNKSITGQIIPVDGGLLCK